MESPIFISYARTDASIATRIANDLRQAGLNVWIDQVDLVAGRHWDIQIQEALNNANTVIVLLTPKSVASANVLDEISFTLNEGKRLVPVMLIKCIPPIRLTRVHYIDFTSNYESGLQNLIRDLGGKKPPEIIKTPTIQPIQQDQLIEKGKTAEVPHPPPFIPDELVQEPQTPQTKKTGEKNLNMYVLAVVAGLFLIFFIIIVDGNKSSSGVEEPVADSAMMIVGDSQYVSPPDNYGDSTKK